VIVSITSASLALIQSMVLHLFMLASMFHVPVSVSVHYTGPDAAQPTGCHQVVVPCPQGAVCLQSALIMCGAASVEP
jgi:hypothetical protein